MQKVLVVDDSAVIRGIIAAVLNKLPNVAFEEVASAAEAMRRLPEQRYALVIADINMPHINGFELLAFIRKNQATHDTPVLIVSSNGSVSDKERGVKLGANGYLVKPFKNEELEASVRNLLHSTP